LASFLCAGVAPLLQAILKSVQKRALNCLPVLLFALLVKILAKVFFLLFLLHIAQFDLPLLIESFLNGLLSHELGLRLLDLLLRFILLLQQRCVDHVAEMVHLSITLAKFFPQLRVSLHAFFLRFIIFCAL